MSKNEALEWGKLRTGIFVFPVVGNAVMYIVSLVIGTVVSALLLGLLKKRVVE